MSGDIAPEVVERMVAVIRAYVGGVPFVSEGSKSIYAEACEIAALLKPVDPDLVEARRVACDAVPSWGEDQERDCTAGKYDKNLFVIIALAAIRRGRELEASFT